MKNLSALLILVGSLSLSPSAYSSGPGSGAGGDVGDRPSVQDLGTLLDLRFDELNSLVRGVVSEHYQKLKIQLKAKRITLHSIQSVDVRSEVTFRFGVAVPYVQSKKDGVPDYCTVMVKKGPKGWSAVVESCDKYD